MSASSERIILTVDKNKKKALIAMLKLFDFVQVETPEDVLKRFIQRAPKNVPLTEVDILNEVMEHRYGKAQ
jgi:hypothetical protein